MINTSQYFQVANNIPIESILDINTFLTKMFHVKHSSFQIDELQQVRAQFITERLAEGATMKQADEEGKDVAKLYEKAKECDDKIKAADEELERK